MPRLFPSAETVGRRRFVTMALLAAAAPAPLLGATPAAAGFPELEGNAADGQRLRLAGLRGRVVLVFYWATGCAVCRDKMRELRANLLGWNGQPFTLLGVNSDPRKQDWMEYERLVAQTTPANQRFASVWAGDSDFRDTMGRPEQLPGANLIDRSGRLVEQYRGRIPPAAWDRIAELL